SFKATESALSQCANAGVSVFAASGDNLANDGESAPITDYPASSVYALGCGASRLVLNPLTETVWNDGHGDGTGGGYAKGIARPSWQDINSSVRGVPDVCANGDPQTGYPLI